MVRNEEAVRTFIQQYEKLVIHIVFKMVSVQEDREDLCQEIFLKTFEKLSSFRFGSKLSTWIGTIAFNSCVNFLKKKKVILTEDFFKTNEDDEAECEIKDMALTPDLSLMTKEKMVLLQKTAETLNPVQRTILQLFHEDNCSLEEISEITNLSLNTVKSHLFRARKLLKKELLHLMYSQ